MKFTNLVCMRMILIDNEYKTLIKKKQTILEKSFIYKCFFFFKN